MTWGARTRPGPTGIERRRHVDTSASPVASPTPLQVDAGTAEHGAPEWAFWLPGPRERRRVEDMLVPGSRHAARITGDAHPVAGPALSLRLRVRPCREPFATVVSLEERWHR